MKEGTKGKDGGYNGDSWEKKKGKRWTIETATQ